jgi:hypothetical protein
MCGKLATVRDMIASLAGSKNPDYGIDGEIRALLVRPAGLLTVLQRIISCWKRSISCGKRSISCGKSPSTAGKNRLPDFDGNAETGAKPRQQGLKWGKHAV